MIKETDREREREAMFYFDFWDEMNTIIRGMNT
jgi:hypothetical protein